MALFKVTAQRAQFDLSDNNSTDVYGAGIRFDQNGFARATTSAGTFFNQGIPMSASGQVSIVDATAGLPSGTIFHNGLPISGEKVCVSRNATSVVSSGLPFDSNGALAADLNFDLNFVNATTLDSNITFTRASSATYFDSAGVLQTATTNTPRFDYNPATLASRGLLIEEQRTNSLSYSAEFDNAYWTKNFSSVSQNAVIAPDSTQTGDKLVADTSTNFHTVARAFSFTSGTAYAISIFAKAGEYQYLTITAGSTATFPGRVTFDLVAGTIASTVSGTGAIQNVGNGWFRCSVVGTATATASTNVNFAASSTGSYVTYTGDGTSGIYIWGAQLEAGAFATSYIPTTTASVTRSADVASVNTLSPWYNATAGTIYAEWDMYAFAAGLNYRASFNDGTTSNALRMRLPPSGTTTVRHEVVNSGVAITLGFPATVNLALTKEAMAFAANDYAGVVNAGTVATSGTLTLPTATQLSLGSRETGIGQLNGHLRRITYYPRRLSNAELQAITA